MEIQLSHGKIALVDPEDYDALSKYKWYAYQHKGKLWYAISGMGAKRKIIHRMHKEILGVHDVIIDHINGDGLDNRRSNLRIVNSHQNIMNSIKRPGKTYAKKPCSSRFKGVYWKADKNKWAAHCQGKFGCGHIGYFNDEVEAAKAYDSAARTYFGVYARCNFLED